MPDFKNLSAKYRAAIAVLIAGAVWVIAPAATAADVPAVEATDGASELRDPRARDAAQAPVRGPVWLEHSASFRLRSDLLVGGDLGNGSSGIPEPLANSAINSDVGDSDILAWAAIRLRYMATIHVGQPWSIHIGLDALDNLVLGSTHVNAGGDFAHGLFTDSQAPPTAGFNSWQDAFRIRQAYGRWKVLNFLDLRFGRIPQNYGMGVWRQFDDCADCDFGTSVDGVRASVLLGGFEIEAGWEAAAVGVTTELPGVPGQPKDLGPEDDVHTWTVSLGRRDFAVGADEGSHLTPWEQGAWLIDWQAWAAITTQTLSSSEPDLADLPIDCQPVSQSPTGQIALEPSRPGSQNHCWRMIPRNTTLYRPGAWFRARWRPDFRSSLRLEVELQALIGDIGNTQRREELEDTDKELRGFGGAFEAEYKRDRLAVGFDFGFATGDDRRYLGVLDGQNIVVRDDAIYLDDEGTNVRDNPVVTSFWFHRDYHVDLILFRQVIGTVTNAVYMKPWVAYTLLDTDDLKLHARFDLLYAAAARPEGTPGNGNHWGVEMDASVAMELPAGFGLNLATGLLIPLDALDDPTTGASPNPAFALRLMATWRY